MRALASRTESHGALRKRDSVGWCRMYRTAYLPISVLAILPLTLTVMCCWPEL